MSKLCLTKTLLAAAGALALTACGGGGGGGMAFIPPPPATPPPPPPNMDAVKIFPSITADTGFAVEDLGATRPSGILTSGSTVRYEAASGLYQMSFPGASEAPFYQFTNTTPSDTWWYGETQQASGNAPATVNVLKPTNPELQFTYSTLASYDTAGMGGGTYGWIAFGTPTAEAAMPKTGAASYTALVRGSTLQETGLITGTASLQFDFAAGTLSGHLDPIYSSYPGLSQSQSLGRYDFADTVYSSGSNSFLGYLDNPQFSSRGSFSGEFTGPAAQELVASWMAPFRNPFTGTDSQMFGVMVGKQQ